jgi:hypothetical protein
MQEAHLKQPVDHAQQQAVPYRRTLWRLSHTEDAVQEMLVLLLGEPLVWQACKDDLQHHR